MRPTKAADVMSESVISLTPEMTLQAAWELLYENKISGAPVIDKNQHVVGVLSQSDLMRELFADSFAEIAKGGFYLDIPFYPAFDAGPVNVSNKLAMLTVAEAMTKEPICVRIDDSISYLARTMRAKHVHRLIVTNDQKLCGIVSSLDLLKVMEMQ